MPLNISTGAASAKGFGFTGNNLIRIPNSGSISQYLNLAYAYGNPTTLSWTRSGDTFSYNLSSATTYCGSTYSTSGTPSITQVLSGGVLVETVSFTFNHPKDCCAGNRNYIYESYTLTMSTSNTATLTATSSSGSQSGC
jgi:hypothetical protein